MTETKIKLYQKLLNIQKEIMGLGKDKSNNTYKYVSGDKVLGTIKPLMNKYGLLLNQEVVDIENTRQDYVVGINAANPNGRPKTEILAKVSMLFTWIDCDTGETLECRWGANGQNDFDKNVGSALTYGERYFLLKFFHIATDEDDIDNPERKAQEEAEKTVKQTALDLVKNSKMDAAAKKEWTNWLSAASAADINAQMDNLNKQIAAFQS